VPKERLDAGCAILRAWGLDATVMPHVIGTDDTFSYLAASDEERAKDLQSAWCDPSVDAVICARGGYGAQRMLELVDWTQMRKADPKVFAGFSDVTALHEAFANHLGVATLHAPMAGAMSFVEDKATAEHLRATLFEPETVQALTSETARTLVPGRAQGVTVGGCLALLAGELATPTGRNNVEGGILLLEDTDEKEYRIDGFITHLLRAGWLEGVAGIALGSWKDCEPVESLMVERLRGLGVPVIWELGFGHGDSTLTMPLGVPATLDAHTATLTLDVPALT
jgi:muramoyltetrapeptide carboxypeptidase